MSLFDGLWEDTKIQQLEGELPSHEYESLLTARKEYDAAKQRLNNLGAALKVKYEKLHPAPDDKHFASCHIVGRKYAVLYHRYLGK